MKNTTSVLTIAAVAVVTASTASAVGSGTGVELGFTEVGNDLNTLLGGAGGFLIIILSIIFGGVMLAIGRGWGGAITAFAVAMFLGYGVTALTSLSGVSASTDAIVMIDQQILPPSSPDMQH